MMEVSFSFLAWLCVLLIQVMVHVKVVYMRKGGRDDDEPLLVEADTPVETSAAFAAAQSPRSFATKRKYVITRSSSDPALDSEGAGYYDDDDDDEPPNLEQRLSQTGTEMMSVSALQNTTGDTDGICYCPL